MVSVEVLKVRYLWKEPTSKGPRGAWFGPLNPFRAANSAAVQQLSWRLQRKLVEMQHYTVIDIHKRSCTYFLWLNNTVSWTIGSGRGSDYKRQYALATSTGLCKV